MAVGAGVPITTTRSYQESTPDIRSPRHSKVPLPWHPPLSWRSIFLRSRCRSGCLRAARREHRKDDFWRHTRQAREECCNSVNFLIAQLYTQLT